MEVEYVTCSTKETISEMTLDEIEKTFQELRQKQEERNKKTWSVSQAAAATGLSISHIRQICGAKLVEACKTNRQWRISPASLLEYFRGYNP